MQCNVFIEHEPSIQFLQISMSHLKENKRQRRERHFNKIYHHGTSDPPPSLTDKMKLLDLHKQKPKLSCHTLAELL